MNNRKRLKKLILANKETRCLYRMMQILVIFMVVSCLVIITLAKWIEYDQNKKREELFGSWDEVFLNVDQEDLNYFRKNAFLEEISIQSIQEKVFLEGDQRVVIGSCDGNFLEMGNIELLEGRMPKHEKEVAIEEEYLEVLGVSEIGDVVPNGSEVESLRGMSLCGIVKNYSTRWKSYNNTVKFINCFVKFKVLEQNQVYVKYSLWANKDQEINMIFYKDNVPKINIRQLRLIPFFMIFIFIEFMLFLIIIRKLERNTPFCKPSRSSVLFNSLKIQKISMIFIRLISMLIIFNLINTSVLMNPMEDTLNRSLFEKISYITNRSGIYLDGTLNEFKINMFLVTNYIVNQLFNIMLLIFAHLIIIYVEVMIQRNNLKKKYNQIYIEKYYRYSINMQNITRNESAYKELSYLIISNITIDVCALFKYPGLDENMYLKLFISYFFISFVFVLILSLIRKYFLWTDLENGI